MGAVHRVPQFPDHLVSAASRERTVQQFRLDDIELLDWIAVAADGCTAIIDPACERMSAERTEERLSNLRPLIQDARTRRASVWFLSPKPLHCYPALAGSSILADAETVRVQPLTDEEALRFAIEGGAAEENAPRLTEFAAGSRALLSAFVSVEISEGSGNDKKDLADQLEGEVARQSFDELGADLSSLLEAWVFEAQMSVVDSDDIPNEAILSALNSSGLVRRTENDSFSVLPFKNREIWVDALAKWIASVIDPPESWSKVAAELFALERDLRFELAKRYESSFGSGWRSASLDAMSAQILELARRDGIPAARSLDELRGPLDWLQLSQLLELAIDHAGSSHFLGLRSSDWEKVGRDVLTVRHRIAHMRLVRAGDLEVVRRARRLIEIRRITTPK